MIQINIGDNVNELLETASPHYRALLLTLREKVIDLAFIVQSNEPFGRQASSSRTTVFVLGDDLHTPLGPTADQTRPRPRAGALGSLGSLGSLTLESRGRLQAIQMTIL